MTQAISIYENSNDTKGSACDVDLFLDGVQSGAWQDAALKIRTIADKDARNLAKKKVPAVTLSGIFSYRNANSLLQHSGLLAMDTDDLGALVEQFKEQLRKDPFVYAAFVSISGRGLCILFKIDPAKHLEAFNGLSKYLYDQYGLLSDQLCKDVSRLRYVSYDPHLFINPDAQTFRKYPPKEKKRPLPKAVFVETDFDAMVQALIPHNICETYDSWVSIGYALVSKFGASANGYFHALSSAASTYDAADCEKKFNYILKSYKDSGKVSTIASIFYLAKLYNIPFYSEQSKLIISHTAMLKKDGLAPAGIADTLQKFQQIPAAESLSIIEQAYEQDTPAESTSVLNDIESWLKYNYDLRYNTVSAQVENNHIALNDRTRNAMFVAAKKVFDKDVSRETLDAIVESPFSPDFHPILEFFDRYKDRQPQGVIEQLFATIATDSPETDYTLYFGLRWLVGMVASAHGEISPLMFTLLGDRQNTGKTRFFRYLLPDELRPYYAESKLDKDTDDAILMARKWLIVDDEMSGKSKKELSKFKGITSRDKMSLRTPYGRYSQDLQRLASLGATGNDIEVLADLMNRRVLPVYVSDFNLDAFYKIDKVDVFMEAYHLYKSGFRWWLDQSDIDKLAINTQKFIEHSHEYELINHHFKIPAPGDMAMEMTATEIKTRMESASVNRVQSIKRLGMELKKIGFQQIVKKEGAVCRRVWVVADRFKEDNRIVIPESEKWLPPQENLPF